MPGSSSTIRILAIGPPFSIGERQHDSEGAADAQFAFQADLAAQRFGDLAHHGEADAGALDSRFLPGAAADELLKDGALFPWVDSHAVVADGDGHAMVPDVPIHPDRPAFGGIFDRILEEVADGAAESLFIGLDGGGTRAETGFDVKAVGGSLIAEVFHRGAHQLEGVVRLDTVLLAAGFHAAEVEEILDQAMEAIGFTIEEKIALAAAGFVGQPVLGQQLGYRAEGSKRGAELVGDG